MSQSSSSAALKQRVTLTTLVGLAFLVSFSALLLFSGSADAGEKIHGEKEIWTYETPEDTEEGSDSTTTDESDSTDDSTATGYVCYLIRVPQGETPDFEEDQAIGMTMDLCSVLALYLTMEGTVRQSY